MGSTARLGVAVSPDGKSVYVASTLSDAVVRLNRNTTTGAISQPAGSAGCISETGAGPCADGHALDGAHGVAVSPDGKSVYVASCDSDAVARLNRNTTTGAITQPAGTAGCISETGSGPCADGHGLDAPTRWRSARTERASTSPRSPATPWRASTATRPPGRSASPPGPPAASARRGGALRRRPRARRRRARWRSARTGRASTSPRATATPWCASTATRPPGRSPSPPGPPAASARRGRGPAPTAMRSTAATGWRSARTGRASTSPRPISDAVARLNRNTTTGAITQPAGTAGCISETGAGPCADGHGLDGARRGGGQPGREERLRQPVGGAPGALQPGALERLTRLGPQDPDAVTSWAGLGPAGCFPDWPLAAPAHLRRGASQPLDPAPATASSSSSCPRD